MNSLTAYDKVIRNWPGIRSVILLFKMRVPVIKQPLTPWQQDQAGETLQTTSLINSNTLPLSDTVQIQVMKSVWQKWKLGGPHYQTFRKLEKTNKSTSLFSLKCFLPGRSSFSFHSCCISHIYVHFLPARQRIQHTPWSSLMCIFSKPGQAFPSLTGDLMSPL